MKKFISVLLMIATVLSLCACESAAERKLREAQEESERLQQELEDTQKEMEDFQQMWDQYEKLRDELTNDK